VVIVAACGGRLRARGHDAQANRSSLPLYGATLTGDAHPARRRADGTSAIAFDHRWRFDERGVGGAIVRLAIGLKPTRVDRLHCRVRNRTLIERPEQLAAAVPRWRTAPWVAIDTEFVRESTFRARLGLVQIAVADEIALVDVVRIRDLSPLAAIVGAPGTR
jgi:hypothetical protein